MKKAFIFPMLAIAAVGLVACNNPAPSSSSSHATGLSSSESTSSTITYSITINNKTALTEEWHLGQAPRSLDLVCPGVNISAAIMSGDITITSSDTTVATVNGTLITPLKAGKATITVAYKTASDNVEIDVGERLGEKNYVTDKTLADLMAVETADLVKDGSNYRGKEAYTIKVKVAKLGNKKDGSASADKYGNMWVVGTDEEPAADGSNFVQVYGSSASIDALAYNNSIQAYKFPGKQDYLDNKNTKDIKVGDILDVIAVRADYNTTKEISFVIRAINGKLISNAVRTTGEVNATEYSTNVAKQLITVSGKITGWAANKTDATKYGNFYMATVGENGEVPENAVPVYVYGATASTTKEVEGGDPVPVIQMKEDNSFKFNNPQDFLTNEVTKEFQIGDMVTLFGYRCDYQGTIELTGIVSKYVEPAKREDPTVASIAEILAKTAPESDKTYKLTGVWEPNNPGAFGNGYLTNPETGDTIMVYGLTATASAIEFDGTSGSPVYKYKNPQDFATNDKTKVLKGGETITVEAINAYFARDKVSEITCVLLSSEANTNKYAASIEVGENGTASLSKTAELAYGEEVTVTATPAEGYVVKSVIFENAWGKKTDIKETMKFKATTGNKVTVEFEEDLPEGTYKVKAKSIVTTTTDCKALTDAGTLTESLNLDKTIFTVTYDKNGAGNDAAVRNDGTVRMYATKNSTNGNKLTFAVKQGYKIEAVQIEFDGDDYSATAKILVNGEAVAATDGVYTVDGSAFTLFNDNTGTSSNTQVRFKNITIRYCVIPENIG